MEFEFSMPLVSSAATYVWQCTILSTQITLQASSIFLVFWFTCSQLYPAFWNYSAFRDLETSSKNVFRIGQFASLATISAVTTFYVNDKILTSRAKLGMTLVLLVVGYLLYVPILVIHKQFKARERENLRSAKLNSFSLDILDSDGAPATRIPAQGLKLHLLRALRDFVVSENESWTTRDVCEKIIKPLTRGDQCSFAEWLENNSKPTKTLHSRRRSTMSFAGVFNQIYSSELGISSELDAEEKIAEGFVKRAAMQLRFDDCVARRKPDVFVSHAWDSQFTELVRTIEAFLADFVVTDNARFSTVDESVLWLDLVLVNQWDVESRTGGTWWRQDLPNFVASIGHTCLVLSTAEPTAVLRRLWCLYEVWCTLAGNAELTMQLSDRHLPRFESQLCSDFFGVMTAYTTVDVTDCCTSHQRDKDSILRALGTYEGGGVAAVNKLVSSIFSDWITACAKEETQGAKSALSSVAHNQENGNTRSEDAGAASTIQTTNSSRPHSGSFNSPMRSPSPIFFPGNNANQTPTHSNGHQQCSFDGLDGLAVRDSPPNSSSKSIADMSMMSVGADSHVGGATNHAGLGMLSSLSMEFDELNRMGVSFLDEGNAEDAEKMFRKALAGYEQLLGPLDPVTLGTVNNLAVLLKDQKKHDEAEQMYRRALAGYEKVIGIDHLDTLHIVNNLAILLKDRKQCDDAEALYRRALAGYEKVVGVEDTYTLRCVYNLANLLSSNPSKYEEAEELYRRALEGRRSTLGTDNSSTLRTMYNLANLFASMRKFDEAEALYHQTLEGRERSLGASHKETCKTAYNLAEVLQKAKHFTRAAKMYDYAYRGHSMRVGPQHALSVEAKNKRDDMHRRKFMMFK